MRLRRRRTSDTARTILATAGFAAVHSLLASTAAKDAAARVFGMRARNVFYRPFFIAQSFVTLAALVKVVFRGRTRTLYEIRGAPGIALQLGRGLGIAYASWAVRHVGFAEITGLRGLAEFAAGREDVAPEPEAQGPAPRPGRATLDTGGPFALSRHPLNLSPLPVLWLAPKVTTRWLAFSLAATAYLVLGSRHEEVRLSRRHGRRYDRYRRRTAFYVPRVPPRALTLRPSVR